jgi:2-polyprenyl-6-methoxyphenol hydroxylase-like FAD-dependent oxidoreductase
MLFCGRHLLDRVMVDVAASTPGLTLREGRVEGVEVRAAQHPEPARAVGVRLDSGELLRAQLVLDAGGRRSRVPSFLAAIGAKPDVVEHDCPLIYYSRHYRFLGTQRPPLNRLFAAGGFLPSLGVMWFPGEADTAILAVVAHARDELARKVTDPAVFTALARAVPTVEPWISESEPISPVFVVAAARSSFRRRPADSDARVLGVHHLGDSFCHTNPTIGRGLSLAAAHANRLVAAMVEHPDEVDVQTDVIDEWSTAEIWPRFVENVGYDRALAASFLAGIAEEPPPAPPPSVEGVVTVGELLAAGMTDAALLRKAMRMMQLLDGSDALHDAGVVAAVRERIPAGFTPPPIAGPTRSELADLIARST